ncbi:MAG TPA: ATP-binding protein [Noviherbaspirillum sp.]|nr:ATP-binding protein [Noviherbaspirillum sp.]
MWLVLACLMPGIIGAAGLFIYQYQEGRTQREKDMIQTARALVQAVDNHLLRAQAIVQTLSAADTLARRDFARFHQRARGALALSGLVTNVVLRDEAGRQILNTAIDFGKPLNPQAAPEQVQKVFATGRPTISPVFIGPVLKRPIMSVDVPVVINGKIAYALGIGIVPEHFNTLLKAQRLPSHWVAGVFDTTGTVAGRTNSPEQFVGRKANARLLQAMMASPEGSLETTTLEGIQTQTFYSRSPVTNWRVAIGIPLRTIEVELLQTLSLLALGVAALLGIGLMLARLMSQRIAHSVTALTAPAIALGEGSPVRVPQVHIKEAAEVATAIGRAAGLLQERSAALQKSEADLRRLIAAIPGTVWTATRDGAVDFVSQQWLDYTGMSLSSQLGAGFLDVIHPEDRKDLLKTWQEAVSKGENFHAEYRILRHDGAYRWFKSWGTPILDENGHCIRWLGVVTDINDLKEAEEALQRTNADLKNRISEKEQAEAEARIAYQRLQETHEQLIQMEKLSALGTLVGGVAHEINNPLMGIKGYIEYVSDKMDEGRPKEVLQRASAEVDRIGRIVKNMLVFSRSKSSLSLGDVDLVQAVTKTVALVEADLQHQNIKLRISAPETPVIARGNMDNIQQAVLNLILNARDALKQHPPPYKVDISVSNEGNGQCIISVADNGPGIPESIKSKIFDPFFTTKPAGQGTGLGLAVTRQLIEASGGSIDVGTAATGGASFVITVAEAEKAAEKVATR